MGLGPAPKHPSQRARSAKSADPPQSILRREIVQAPKLPSKYERADLRRWWDSWVLSPQADHFGRTDWQYLLDTLELQKRYYDGELTHAAELRLRAAKFGATPEDRARLRMWWAQADEADAKRPEPKQDRFADLTVVDGAVARPA